MPIGRNPGPRFPAIRRIQAVFEPLAPRSAGRARSQPHSGMVQHKEPAHPCFGPRPAQAKAHVVDAPWPGSGGLFGPQGLLVEVKQQPWSFAVHAQGMGRRGAEPRRHGHAEQLVPGAAAVPQFKPRPGPVQHQLQREVVFGHGHAGPLPIAPQQARLPLHAQPHFQRVIKRVGEGYGLGGDADASEAVGPVAHVEASGHQLGQPALGLAQGPASPVVAELVQQQRVGRQRLGPQRCGRYTQAAQQHQG